MSSEEIKPLIRKRGTIKHKLTILEKFITSITDLSPDEIPNLDEITLRHNKNLNLLQEFDEVQTAIEALCDEDTLHEQFAVREDFDTRYFKTQSFLAQYLHVNDSQLDKDIGGSSSSCGKDVNNDNFQNILLPKLKLPTFSGNFEQWIHFKTNFSSIIISNSTLTDFQKFQFLKASLEGYSSRLIDGLDNIRKPFEKAWQLLCDKFDKKQFLLDTHFQQLINVQAINKENFQQFSKLLDHMTKHVNAVNGIGLDFETLFNYLMIHIISSKLDKTTLRNWKEVNYKEEVPTLQEFITFIKNKVDLLQSLEYSFNSQPKTFIPNSKPNALKQVNFMANTNNYTIQCNYCGKSHSIYKCEEFLKLSILERIEKVKALKLCNNCLRTGHKVEKCFLSPCKICKSANKVFKHNSLLHKEHPLVKESIDPDVSVNFKTAIEPISNSIKGQVLLSTIQCKVKDAKGQFVTCRALLDCGAQSNLLSTSLFNKLGLPFSPVNLSLLGINQIASKLEKRCEISIFSCNSDFTCTIPCFVTPIINNRIPFHIVNMDSLVFPKQVVLADPSFYQPSEIDLLLGVEIFWKLITNGKFSFGNNLPVLQNTQFGYIVSGYWPFDLNEVTLCTLSKIHTPEDDQLKKFWELEEVNLSPIVSDENLECEKQFHLNTSKDLNGHFIVKFPLKHSPSVLGDSKTTAIKRFLSLEKRFVEPKFKQLYFDFIHEYQELGHMTKMPKNYLQESSSIQYFLPHHGVLKEQSLTTKLRTVFDGSCSTSSGWSLNDLQYTGPKLQNDIFDILVRFRSYFYAASADVSKMYRCIWMHNDHRSLQQIIWRESPEEEFSVFQLNTVSYGTRSAPFLAIKCLQTLALENQLTFPNACHTILNDFYVDDLLTGSNDLLELKQRCSRIYSILEKGNFVLRKWVSNNVEITSNFENSNISNSILNIGNNENCKTLGIQWDPCTDCLKYNIQTNIPISITKRCILSTVAQIYDPLGLLAPIIIIFKIIIQRLWSLNISWDSQIPEQLEKSFIDLITNLDYLNKLSLPRCILPYRSQLTEIHCFCDASKEAYATAVYIKSTDSNGTFHVRLLCSKSKVAPLKMITIPKLELSACLLGSQLINSVKQSLDLSTPIFMWSDSMVALSWINNEPSLLQIFVANRVSKIQSLTNITQWNYVPSKENPADIASRGIKASTFINSSLWWNGPQFLKQDKDHWPSHISRIPVYELPELKKKAFVFHQIKVEFFDIFLRFSSLSKLRRVIALCFRFYHNLKCKFSNSSPKSGFISVDELNNANNILIRLVQADCFQSDIDILTKNQLLPRKNRLTSLTPFLDKDNILRVGGRLKFTSLPYNFKHPILLHSSHPLTKLLFIEKHKMLLHPGPQLLLASIRQFYWPIGGRILARKITKECITCFKFNPVSYVSPMAPLPDIRIEQRFPFEITGIDYAGPFFILTKPGRGSRTYKCYLAVFVCFCTKAVHLEIISDLTTSSFLSCLKRFTSRRGLPKKIYSDNGTTFVGASNELRMLGIFLNNHHASIADATSQNNIQWIFIPPYTPNFGGLWEAAVKSAKHHLNRVLMNRNVTYEEFNTLVIQVEGILNSRPLFSSSNDPNDITSITPSHFLIGRPILHVPEREIENIQYGRVPRVQHIQQLCQQFWKQFSEHYISQLRVQYKWRDKSSTIHKDALVLIKNDKQPSYKWPLGRIIDLIPSKDGVFRIAKVKVSTGQVTRSVRHLFPLPLQEETIQ